MFDSDHLAVYEHEVHHIGVYKRVNWSDLQSICRFSQLSSTHAASLECRFHGYQTLSKIVFESGHLADRKKKGDDVTSRRTREKV